MKQKESQKLRDKAYTKYCYSRSVEDWNNYTNTRNDVIAIIRKTKRDYYNNKIHSNKNDSKQMWKTLKAINQ